MINTSENFYHDEAAARRHLEELRWPNGPVCPHCGEAQQVKELRGRSHRPGLYKCYACKRHFSVTVGTVFEGSKVPLKKWLLAAHLMASGDKPVNAHHVHKTIGVTYKTACNMMRRLREASRGTPAANSPGREISVSSAGHRGNENVEKEDTAEQDTADDLLMALSRRPARRQRR
jgi:transposase-like protein